MNNKIFSLRYYTARRVPIVRLILLSDVRRLVPKTDRHCVQEYRIKRRRAVLARARTVRAHNTVDERRCFFLFFVFRGRFETFIGTPVYLQYYNIIMRDKMEGRGVR